MNKNIKIFLIIFCIAFIALIVFYQGASRTNKYTQPQLSPQYSGFSGSSGPSFAICSAELFDKNEREIKKDLISKRANTEKTDKQISLEIADSILQETSNKCVTEVRPSPGTPLDVTSRSHLEYQTIRASLQDIIYKFALDNR